MPVTDSAPRSPTLVTVTVGEVSSELRKFPRRARSTRSRMARHQFGERFLIRVPNCRRDQPAAAQRNRPTDVNARRRNKGAIFISAVELRLLAQGQGRSLEKEHGGQNAFDWGLLGVEALDPGQSAAQFDRFCEVIVRNFPLRATHRGGDRLAHLGKIEAFFCRALCELCAARVRFDIGEPDRSLDAGSLHDGCDVETQRRRAAPRCGRNL